MRIFRSVSFWLPHPARSIALLLYTFVGRTGALFCCSSLSRAHMRPSRVAGRRSFYYLQRFFLFSARCRLRVQPPDKNDCENLQGAPPACNNEALSLSRLFSYASLSPAYDVGCRTTVREEFTSLKRGGLPLTREGGGNFSCRYTYIVYRNDFRTSSPALHPRLVRDNCKWKRSAALVASTEEVTPLPIVVYV